MTFADAARAYEQEPGPATLSELRSVILAHATYRPDADAAAATAVARGAGEQSDVVAILNSMMPGSHLSPSAHGYLAEANDALGDAAAAQRERELAKLAVRGILATGDGTQAAPWSVLRISDEYDVLSVLGRRSTSQELVRASGRRYDKHNHADGTETWFDVTALPEPRRG